MILVSFLDKNNCTMYSPINCNFYSYLEANTQAKSLFFTPL